jgi:hypothetical protein
MDTSPAKVNHDGSGNQQFKKMIAKNKNHKKDHICCSLL